MSDDGHGWNKELEHDYYVDNVAKHGAVTAREMSRRNIRSYRNEVAGLPTPFSWRVNDEGTDAVSEDGFSLMEMARNPLEGKHADKASANHREAAKLIIPTSEQALALAAAGEKLIIFPEHDVNKNGVVARFLTIWEQDKSDKKLYHGRRVDLGVGIKIDKIREKTKNMVLGDQPVQYHEDSEKKDAFVFSVSKPTIQTEDVSKPLYDSIHLVKDSPDPEISVVDLPRVIINDNPSVTKEEKEILIVDLQDSKKELFLLLTDLSKEEALTRLTQAPVEFEGLKIKTETLNELWKKIAQEELHISVEQSEKLLESVRVTWISMEEKKEEIALASEMRVAVGGVLLLLDQMVHLETGEVVEQSAQIDEKIVVDEIFETWEVMQGAQEVISIAASESVFIPAALLALNELTHLPKVEEILIVEPVVLTEEEKKEVFDRIVFEETIEFIKKIEALPVVEQQQMIVKEKEQVEEKIVQVWEAVAAIKPDATIHSPSEQVDLEPEKKNVEQFSFAFAMWMVLKLINYRSVLVTLEELVKPEEHKIKPEMLIQKETGSWLLLSIIWYLAQIREQGMYSNQTSPPQKKKRKVFVIYAYAS